MNSRMTSEMVSEAANGLKEMAKIAEQIRQIEAEKEAVKAAKEVARLEELEEARKRLHAWTDLGIHAPSVPTRQLAPVVTPVVAEVPQVPKVIPDGEATKTKARQDVLRASLKQGETRFMLSKDPHKCLWRICQYVLNMTTGDERAQALTWFKAFRFDDLYPGYDVDWNAQFRRLYGKMAAEKKRKGLPLFVVEKVVREVIPKADWVYNSTGGKKRQDIKPVELAFILKSIVNLLRMRGGTDARKMTRFYFLTEKHRESYKKDTKRRLNTGKLARITDLLTKYGLVEKVRKTKFDPLHFKLGPKAALIPRVPRPSRQI